MSERDKDPTSIPDDDAGASSPWLDEAVERALGEALHAAWDPTPLDPERHARLLERALTDPFAPASEDEARESERLRQALEAGDESHADVRLLRALSLAKEPPPLTSEAKAQARLGRKGGARTANVVFVSFGAMALAAAAALALVVGGGVGKDEAPRAERLVPSRSTTDLFEHEFAQGETTERIDRIASSRARDLRQNRYVMWGAR